MLILMLDILQNLACAVAVGLAHAPHANPNGMTLRIQSNEMMLRRPPALRTGRQAPARHTQCSRCRCVRPQTSSAISRCRAVQGCRLWVSCFEIYGGKLFDLLNSRQQLVMREDGKGRVCIVGLKEVCPWALENSQVSESLHTVHWVSAMSGYYATHGLLHTLDMMGHEILLCGGIIARLQVLLSPHK